MATKKKYNLPTGYPFLPTLFRSNDFLANPIRFISQSMEKFGGTYTATLGLSKKIILTQDPEFINYILKVNHKNYHKSPLATERAVEFFGNGLLFSNGEYWLRQRRLIQPAFHKEKLQGLFEIVKRSIDGYLENFPTGTEDVYPLLHQMSFSVLIRSLFDIRISPELMVELGQLFTSLQEFLMRDVNRPIQRLLYPLNGLKKAHLKKAARLKEILSGIISERRKDAGEYNDLLDMLLNSRYEDTGEAMTDGQIIDEALIMIFAGHETTANALSWMLHLLSNDEASVARLQDEIRNMSIDQSIRNPWFNAVISEAMRLYPPAWMTERVAVADDVFGEYSYPKGTILIPFFYGLHRNRDLWVNENAFVPQRFVDDEKLARSINFFPFGAGPRMCIGNNFAMTEMCFFLYSFFTKFNIKPAGQQPEMRPLITLRPNNVILNIQRT
ncbi:MAG: cytochrome P450, partial [Chitinophagaceae bacterium]